MVCSFSFHHSIILTIGRLPFLGSGGFGQLGLAASRSLISKLRSVTSKRIRFVSKVSALGSSLRPLLYTPLILAHSVGFCPNNFKNPPLNICPFPRFLFVVVLSAPLVRLPFVLSSCLYFLHCRHVFFCNLRAYCGLLKTISIFGSFSIAFYYIVVAATTSLIGGAGGFMLFDQFFADLL
jgi:hypothetical protein